MIDVETDSTTTAAGLITALSGDFYKWDLEETRPLILMAQKPKNAGLELLTVLFLNTWKGASERS